ncbi:MAG: PDZ domain-containing protein [Acidimicrobiia bacterium]|nr:PDZ domain-containing protein [Acidimicrobiia bacterium]
MTDPAPPAPPPVSAPAPGAGAPHDPTGDARKRRRRRLIVGGIAAGVVLLILAAGLLIPLPYIVFSPGSATPVEDVVTIDGAQTYEPDGDILFLTVTVSGRAVPFQVLWGWIDDDSEVVKEDEYLQGSSREEVREIGRIAMVESQEVATIVALETLGYEVPVHGDGAVVRAVEEGRPADGELEEGDVIVAVDGETVELSPDAGELVRAHAPGETVEVEFVRDGTTQTTVLETAESDDGLALIGVALQTENLQIDYPVDVQIDSGRVGGPSAGLAFTLAIIDQLTEGELTGGMKVAVTGTMRSDGMVGLVGGVSQKAAAAKDAGAELFLVPTGEEEDALKHAGGVKVVAVETIDDALAALEEAGGDPLVSPLEDVLEPAA